MSRIYTVLAYPRRKPEETKPYEIKMKLVASSEDPGEFDEVYMTNAELGCSRNFSTPAYDDDLEIIEDWLDEHALVLKREPRP